MKIPRRLQLLAVPALLVAVPASAGSAPQVSACVLDGGGSVDERACGIERAMGMIDATYKGLGAGVKYQVLTGSGVVGAKACRGTAVICKDPKNNASCGPELVSEDKYNGSGKLTRTPKLLDQNLELKNPPFPASAATSDSFDRNCFFDSKSPPNPPIPVCNFWNLNHGSPQGSMFFNPNPGQPDPPPLDADRLASKAAGCGTFRFVTNVCYGAKLSKVIYGTDGRVVEGRCGMAASPPSYQANGFEGFEAKAPVVTATGLVANEANPAARDLDKKVAYSAKKNTVFYPLIDGITQMSNVYEASCQNNPCSTKTASLDWMGASLKYTGYTPNPGQLKGNYVPTLRTPYMTSDFFLEDKSTTKIDIEQPTTTTSIVPFESERARQIDAVLAPYTQTLSQIRPCEGANPFARIEAFVEAAAPSLGLGTSRFTDAETQEIKALLADEGKKVASFKYQLCDAFKKPRDCDAGAIYADYRKERDEYLRAYDLAKATADQKRAALLKRCSAVGIEASSCATDSAICGALKHFASDPVSGCQGQDNNVLTCNPGMLKEIKIAGSCASSELMKDKLARLNATVAARAASIEADRKAAETQDTAEQYLTSTQYLRQYENVATRFARVLDLLKKAKSPGLDCKDSKGGAIDCKENVLDLMKLHRCEAGDFAQPVARSWDEYRKQQHIQ